MLKAPFPWFGGKRRVAHVVWERFGDTANYVEPFAGSLAVLLARPHEPRAETVNDLDCFVSNFWRALSRDPDEVAHWADHPVNEADLHARHIWLVKQTEFREHIKTDPDYCDAKIAGWWVWGISQWIGSGWCVKPEWTGRFNGIMPKGVHAKRPRLGRGERGVCRKLPRLDRGGTGVDIRNPSRAMPCLHGDSGATGRGVHASGLEDRGGLVDWFHALADRLRRVRVCCGDWKRILGPSPTTCIGTTAVFLDPPYGERMGDDLVYNEDSLTVAAEVRSWAIEHGDDPLFRIALCGYEGEHVLPDSWDCVAWKAHGGYANRSVDNNNDRERIWFSPHCLQPAVDHQQRISEIA